MRKKYWIGTSGYYYDDWLGRFYPSDLGKNKLLQYYARYFSTVELNSTFYHLPQQKTIQNWISRLCYR